MQAVILAAGRGSRVAGLTAEKPKCLIEFCGKSLLDWQLEALRGAGIKKIALVTGYLSEKLDRVDLVKFHNSDWSRTNMVCSLMCAKTWVEQEETIVSYADIIYPPSTVQMIISSRGDIGIPYNTRWKEIWEARFSDPLADAETFKFTKNNFLEEIGNHPKTLEEVMGQYMGLLKFSPGGWKKVFRVLSEFPPEKTRKMDMTTLLRACLQAGIPIFVFPIEGKWYEVDSEEDLKSYQKLVEKNHGKPW